MIPSICTKIQSLIDNGISQESHVVYLLVCIRKVLEQEDDISQYEMLKFYCDWGLHAKLSGPTAQQTLAVFNKGHIILSNGKHNLPNEIQDISKFNKLVADLGMFFSQHSIVLPQYSSSDWAKVLFLYASVIEDCPLVIKSHLSPESSITKVTAKVEVAKEVELGQRYYKVSWIITDTEGKDGELFVINSFDA